MVVVVACSNRLVGSRVQFTPDEHLSLARDGSISRVTVEQPAMEFHSQKSSSSSSSHPTFNGSADDRASPETPTSRTRRMTNYPA